MFLQAIDPPSSCRFLQIEQVDQKFQGYVVDRCPTFMAVTFYIPQFQPKLTADANFCQTAETYLYT